ncbi:MAG TPA: diacylglycerol kinase [Gammaproteobacteria bacterium]|nr:diacylglycerol kinase [Gammaproteobacteria bacterium]
MPAADDVRGIARLVRAARVSLAALVWGFRHEEAIRLEFLGLAVCVPLAFWLGENGIERAVLIASVLLILLVELLNTAIERTIDRIGPERHELSRLAKDMGSAAVMIALCIAATVWGLVVWG